MTQSIDAAFDFVREAEALLETEHFGRTIRAFHAIDSTNTYASAWIERDAPHGAVVIADFQRTGRGRHGRSWSAHRGLNLTFSVILRPNLPTDRMGMLTIAACTGAAAAIDPFIDPLQTHVKWPNDLYLNHQKICGMLLEASWSAPGRRPAVVLGIGVNVNQVDFPDDLSGRATSLFLETGRVIPRAILFAGLLTSLESALNRLHGNEEEIRREYARRLMSLGETVRLRFMESGNEIEGRVCGIAESGGLVLATRAGNQIFHAGEVTRA